MKKWLKIACIALAAALVIGGAFAALILTGAFYKGDLTGAAAKYSVIGRDIPTFLFNEGGVFTILQFTDTHFDMGRGRDRKLLAKIAAQVDEVKPDLVVVTGDMLDGRNACLVRNKRAALEGIADVFESRGQHWAYVPGNNDGEVLGSTADVVAFLGRNYDYCIVGNAENVTGETHYVIPLMTEYGEAHRLVFMDSGMRDPATNYMSYDCFKQDQADWLAAQLDELKQTAPRAKASVFFHFNTPAFHQAISDVWDNIPGNKIVDDVIETAGNVGLVSIGHVHPPANWLAEWNGRHYLVARADGGTKISINSNGEHQFEELAF